jgi:hypothetical protein
VIEYPPASNQLVEYVPAEFVEVNETGGVVVSPEYSIFTVYDVVTKNDPGPVRFTLSGLLIKY